MENNRDIDIQLEAGLNLSTSEKQLINDIKELQKRIEAAGLGKIKLTAEFDQDLVKAVKALSKSKDIVSAGQNLGDTLAKSLINSFDVKSKDAQRQIKTLSKSLYDMSIKELKTGTDNPAFLQTFDKLGEIVKNNANIIQSRMGIYDSFYQYFQGLNKIKIPDVVRSDLGKDWDTLRKTAASKFVVDKPGIELDSIYQELSDKYKDIFSGTTDQTQQFREIVNALKAYRADIDKLTPIDPTKTTGFEDSMWSEVLGGIGKMREQIKAQLPQLQTDIEQTAGKVKQSLLDVDISFDNGDINQLAADIKSYFSKLSGLSDQNIKLQFFKDAEEEVVSFSATLDKGQGIVEKYKFALNDMGQFVYAGGNLIDQSGKDYAEATTKAAQYQQKLEALKATYKSFLLGTAANNPFKAAVEGIDFTNITDKSSLEAMIDKFNEAEAKAKALNSELSKKWSSSGAEKLEQYIKELPQDIDYLESKFKGANFAIPDNIKQSFEQMRQVLGQINQTDNPGRKIALYNQLTGALNKVTKQYKQLSQEKKNATKDEALNLQKNKLNTSIQSWSNQNTAAAKLFSAELSNIQSKIQTADKASLGNLQKEFSNVQAKAKELGVTSSSVTREIRDEFNRTVESVVSLTAAFQTFRRMISTARELDTNLFNLQVATGNTREQTKELLDTYNQMARELGATTGQVAAASNEWLRQGRSIEESNMLIKDSLILSKIGMIDSAQATEYLTSTLNGYQLQASSALEIISKLSSVDLESASDAGGIAASMSRTATSAKQAGLEIDELIGIIATLKDVSQAPNEEIGNAIKSIVSRYSQVKANKFVDYESGDDLSNVEKVLGKVGVKIRSSVGDFRDLSDVLSELAGKWDTLNDTERNAVSYNLFGTYQSEKGKVLMANWDKVKQLTEVSAQSSTEALDKFAAYSEGLEAHINSLTAAYENLASKIADSEFLKGSADAGAVLLDTISQIIDKLGVLSATAGALTMGAGLKGKNIGIFGNNGTELTFLGKTIEDIKEASAAGEKFGGLFTSNVVQPISNAQNIISNYNKLVEAQCVSQARINKLTDDEGMRKYLKGLNGAKAGMSGYTASLNMGTAATIGLKAATVALNMAFNMAVIGAITAGITFLVDKYHELNPSIEEASQNLSEQQRILDEQSNKIASISKELEIAQNRIEELQNIGSLSFVQSEELQKLKSTTTELEAQLSIEKERLALKAQEALKSANQSYDTYKVVYDNNGDKYSAQLKGLHGASQAVGLYGDYVPDTATHSENPIEELKNTIKAYEKTYAEYMELTAKIASGEGDVLGMAAEQEKLSKSLVDIRQHAMDTYNIINAVNDAYTDISRSGQEFTDVEKEQYAQTMKGITIYNDFLKGLKEGQQEIDNASEALDTYANSADSAQEAQEDLNAALKAVPEGKQIANINDMSKGFEKLDKIMADVKNKGTFDYTSLADTDFTETFGNLDSYSDFIKTISTYPDDLSKCQEAINALVTEWLNSSAALRDVDASTADVTEKMLENMGVVNAHEIVQTALIKKTYEAALANMDLRKSVEENSQAFRDEMSVFDLTEIELDNLTIAYANAQNTMTIALSEGVDGRLNILEGELQAIKGVADAYNLIAGKINESAAKTGDTSAEAQRNLATNMKLNPELDAQVQGIIDYGNQMDDIQAIIDKARGSKGNVVYGGGNKTNSSGGSKSAKENSDLDWIDRRIELIKSKNSELEEALSDTWVKWTGLTNEEATRARELFNSSLSPESDEVDELIALAQKAGMSIGELQTALQSGTGFESRQSILGELIENDKKLIGEYQTAADQYRDSYEKLVAQVPEYRDKIENGGEEIELVPGELKTQVDNAKDAYDKWKAAVKSVDDQTKALRDHHEQSFQNIIDPIDAENERLAQTNNLLEKQAEYLTTGGHIVSSSLYESILDNTDTQIKNTKKILKTRQDELADALARGVKEGTEEYYEYLSKISEAESALLDLEIAQEEYNKKLRELPIHNMQILIDMQNSLLDSITNWGAEQESAGKKLNADYYQALIENGVTAIGQLKEQAGIIQDIMGDYDVGSDNWKELFDQLQSVNSEMSAMVENLNEWNQALLQLPLTEINEHVDSLKNVKSALDGVQADYNTVISTVVDAINKQKEALQKVNDTTNDEYDAQKQALQDRLDLLKKQNEELGLQQDYEQALYELQRANTQKTERVIREGELVYEQNADNLVSAEEKVQDALEALTEYDLQKQIDDLGDALEKINDDYQNQIDALDKIAEKWEKIKTDVEAAQNAALTTQYLGENWKDKVQSGNDWDIYASFKSDYESNAEMIQKYEKQIEATENIYALLENYVESYKNGTLTYEQAMMGMTSILSQMNQEMSTGKNLQNVLDYYGAIVGSDATTEGVLTGIQEDLKESSDEMLENMKQYNDNLALIADCMTSWEQLVDNTNKMVDLLEEVRDNLAEALEGLEDDDDDRGSGGGKSGGSSNWLSDDADHGPGVHHRGSLAGYVGGDSDDERLKMMQYLANVELKPNDIPIIAEKGELVVTPEEVDQILGNVDLATIDPSKFVVSAQPDLSFADISYPEIEPMSQRVTVDIHMGDINLPNVQNTADFCREFGNVFEATMRQKFSNMKFQ